MALIRLGTHFLKQITPNIWKNHLLSNGIASKTQYYMLEEALKAKKERTVAGVDCFNYFRNPRLGESSIPPKTARHNPVVSTKDGAQGTITTVHNDTKPTKNIPTFKTTGLNTMDHSLGPRKERYDFYKKYEAATRGTRSTSSARKQINPKEGGTSGVAAVSALKTVVGMNDLQRQRQGVKSEQRWKGGMNTKHSLASVQPRITSASGITWHLSKPNTNEVKEKGKGRINPIASVGLKPIPKQAQDEKTSSRAANEGNFMPRHTNQSAQTPKPSEQNQWVGSKEEIPPIIKTVVTSNESYTLKCVRMLGTLTKLVDAHANMYISRVRSVEPKTNYSTIHSTHQLPVKSMPNSAKGQAGKMNGKVSGRSSGELNNRYWEIRSKMKQ